MPESVLTCIINIIAGLEPREYIAYVLDENGDKVAENLFEWRYDSTALNLDLGELSRADQSGAAPKNNLNVVFGQHLFQTIFAGPVGILWQEMRTQARRQPLRLVIRIDPQTARPLLNLPWEYLHDGQEFLALNWHTPLSRLPSNIIAEPYEPLDKALRMLVVIAAPTGLDENHVLNYAREEDIILASTSRARQSGRLLVEFTPNGSQDALETYLRDYDPHILHVVAHGTFDKEQDCGSIQLEDEQGGGKLVPNEEFADLIGKQDRSLRLVFLSACQSAIVSQNNGFADLGPRLLAADILAVVAMARMAINCKYSV